MGIGHSQRLCRSDSPALLMPVSMTARVGGQRRVFHIAQERYPDMSQAFDVA
ncbi:MAG: hypothetical protein ACLQJ7_02090 [Syntrophobacteraceae bacterium]